MYLALESGLSRSYRISVPGSTQVSDGRQSIFAYGAVTLYGRLSHTFPLTDCFVTSICQTLQPHISKLIWFGPFSVRSPLLGEYFLFLQVLRCFSSLGALPPTYVFSRRILGVFARWSFLIRKFPDQSLYTAPETYRSVPRPSSAFGAKAFTESP